MAIRMIAFINKSFSSLGEDEDKNIEFAMNHKEGEKFRESISYFANALFKFLISMEEEEILRVVFNSSVEYIGYTVTSNVWDDFNDNYYKQYKSNFYGSHYDGNTIPDKCLCFFLKNREKLCEIYKIILNELLSKINNHYDENILKYKDLLNSDKLNQFLRAPHDHEYAINIGCDLRNMIFHKNLMKIIQLKVNTSSKNVYFLVGNEHLDGLQSLLGSENNVDVYIYRKNEVPPELADFEPIAGPVIKIVDKFAGCEEEQEKVKKEEADSDTPSERRVKGDNVSKERKTSISGMNRNISTVSSHLMLFKSLDEHAAEKSLVRLARHANNISSGQVSTLIKKFENSENTSQTVKKTEINTESNSLSVRDRVRQLNQQTTSGDCMQPCHL